MSLLNVQYDEMSYDNLTNIRHNFRRIEPDAFRKYDEPGFFFWKPLFYFYNGNDEAYGLGSSGLLHPSWTPETMYTEIIDDSNKDSNKALKDVAGIERDVQLPNSAYNYLLRNDEQKRAALLKDFIILLSEISSKTPWYFKEVSGLDEALSRSSFYKTPKVDEERKKITITCLVDSIDTRIGNMLDMYRAACFSWQTKREIVPANLRKFDMGIYIFLQPTQRNIHKNIKRVSHKYLEFHNCEIDIDSCKVNDSFSNETAQSIEYKIVISYDHCFDNRYSNGVLGLIGDAISTDFIVSDNLNTDVDNFLLSSKERPDYTGVGEYGEMYNYKLTGDKTSKDDNMELKNLEPELVYNLYGHKPKTKQELASTGKNNFFTKLLNNVQDATLGAAEQAIRNGLGRLLLGNLYHGSILNGLRSIGQGNIMTGGTDVVKAITNKDTYKGAVESALGSFKSATVDKINKPKNKTVTNLGNLNQNKSIINNI